MKITRNVLLLLLLLTGLRLCFCALYEVQPKEAYWYLCGTHLDWAYFDAPGGVPLLAAISTAIFGPSAFGIRFFMPFFALGTSWLLYLLARKYIKGWMAAFPVAVINALPIFNAASVELSGAMPSLMFSMLALCSAWRALKKERGNGGWWALAGLAVALGEYMHLATAIVILSILFSAASTRRFRHELIRPSFALFLIPSLLVAGLLIAWNRQNDWVWLTTGTFRTALSFSFVDFLRTAGYALMELNPLIVILAVYTVFRLAQNIRLHVRPRMILAFCIPPVILWFYLGLLGISYSWLLIFPLGVLLIALADYLDEIVWVNVLAKTALVAAAITTLWSVAQSLAVVTPWANFAEKVQKAKKSANEEMPLFLIAKDADSASVFSYHLRRLGSASKDFPPVFVKESQGYESQFSLWPRYEQFVDAENAPDEFYTEAKAVNPYMGRSALYVTDEEELPQTIHGAFTEVNLLEILTPGEENKNSPTIRIYHCKDYQTAPL